MLLLIRVYNAGPAPAENVAVDLQPGRPDTLAPVLVRDNVPFALIPGEERVMPYNGEQIAHFYCRVQWTDGSPEPHVRSVQFDIPPAR